MLTIGATAVAFQFTPLREGRHALRSPYCLYIHISIHAPPRGATLTVIFVHLHGRFQFTPLREGRRPSEWRYCRQNYFNSRPSARGDAIGTTHGTAARKISIHAPPRGATNSRRQVVCGKSISIHAPPRGATNGFLLSSRCPWHFNSRPSARGDTKAHDAGKKAWKFQFTPLREGRPCFVVENVAVGVFQFTPLREGRLHARRNGRFAILFQFTPLREGRPSVTAG